MMIVTMIILNTNDNSNKNQSCNNIIDSITRSSEMNVAPWLRQIMLEVKRLLRLEKWMTFGQIYTLMMILAVTGYWL